MTTTHFSSIETGDYDSMVEDTSTAQEKINVADVSARVQELTATGVVTAGVQSVELNHASVAIGGTIADLANHAGFFFVKFTGTGTESHTLTCTTGTFDGTNNKITLNAHDEAILFYVCSDGTGTIIENVGTVGLSSV